jgi:hypothetical protein
VRKHSFARVPDIPVQMLKREELRELPAMICEQLMVADTGMHIVDLILKILRWQSNNKDKTGQHKILSYQKTSWQ